MDLLHDVNQDTVEELKEELREDIEKKLASKKYREAEGTPASEAEKEKAVEFAARTATKLSERELLQADLAAMSNEELSIFIPDIYQEKVFNKEIYRDLQKKGIKLISFDIDDTLGDVMIHNIKAKLPIFTMPKDVVALFEYLKDMGFIVTLITNAHEDLARGASKALKLTDEQYISLASKPEPASFEVMMNRFKVDKSQMAHIGNSMRDDVVGGNRAGVTTVLVRRNGVSMKLSKLFAKFFLRRPTKGHLIRKELERRDMWHKHHESRKDDQYYWLDEKQKNSPNFQRYSGK